MIMMVYFSDNTTSYQSNFDKLWAYYKNFAPDGAPPNGNNGVMHWRINGFSSAEGNGAASDAEFDVALALVMAHYQFGDIKYLNDAKSLIAKIRLYEFENSGNTSGLHKPGNTWGNNPKRNPSYVSPAAFEIFREVEDNQETFWSNAISKNYTLLKDNQSKSSAKLPSDWCNDNGSVNGAEEFGYDASRAPWRWAWSNAWYGHADAKTLLENLAPWVNGLTPANVGGPIQLNGTIGGHKNSTFVGPLTNVLSYSSSYKSKMNDFWDVLIDINENAYFNISMQLLTALLASGNMPNLKALAAGDGGSSSSLSLSSSSSNGNGDGDGGSSSGTSPVMLSQVVNVNKALLVKNGVSLQVADNATLEVFNLKGNLLYKQDFTNGTWSVQLPGLPKGLYIAKIRLGNRKEILQIPIR